jgi:hypothetical protein
MRTPRATIGGQDSLMQQAANLAKMRDMQTPLLGGENPDLAGRSAVRASLCLVFVVGWLYWWLSCLQGVIL